MMFAPHPDRESPSGGGETLENPRAHAAEGVMVWVSLSTLQAEMDTMLHNAVKFQEPGEGTGALKAE